MNRKNSGDDDSFEKEKEIIAGRETVKRKEATRVPKVAEKLNLARSKIQSWRSRREREARVPREERRKDSAGILKGEKEKEAGAWGQIGELEEEGE